MTAPAKVEGQCLFCNCTEARGCEGGCSWTDGTKTLCSQCDASLELVEKVVSIFAHLGPRLRPPAPLASPEWNDLNFEQQQLLVMGHRRICEASRIALAEDLEEEAIESINTVRQILQFLSSHCPHELREDESLPDIVARLLRPHVGSRIILPGVHM